MIDKHQPSPDQINVRKRNDITQVMDALGVNREGALVFLHGLAALERQHPEKGVGKVPLKSILQAAQQMVPRIQAKKKMDITLNGQAQGSTNLDAMLGSHS